MFVSFGVLLALADFRFDIQLGSFIAYTAFVFLASFVLSSLQMDTHIRDSIMHRPIRHV